MFQFSGFAHLSVYYVFNIVGCPIQVSADQSVCARPRSFSQLITPFIASESQGIPHTPLFCLLYQSCYLKQDRFFCFLLVITKNAFYFLLFSYLNMSMNFVSFNRQTVNSVNRLNKSTIKRWIVENNGVEPLTSCVQGRRSSQLS